MALILRLGAGLELYSIKYLLDAVRAPALTSSLLSSERKTKSSFNSLKEEKVVP